MFTRRNFSLSLAASALIGCHQKNPPAPPETTPEHLEAIKAGVQRIRSSTPYSTNKQARKYTERSKTLLSKIFLLLAYQGLPDKGKDSPEVHQYLQKETPELLNILTETEGMVEQLSPSALVDLHSFMSEGGAVRRTIERQFKRGLVAAGLSRRQRAKFMSQFRVAVANMREVRPCDLVSSYRHHAKALRPTENIEVSEASANKAFWSAATTLSSDRSKTNKKAKPLCRDLTTLEDMWVETLQQSQPQILKSPGRVLLVLTENRSLGIQPIANALVKFLSEKKTSWLEVTYSNDMSPRSLKRYIKKRTIDKVVHIDPVRNSSSGRIVTLKLHHQNRKEYVSLAESAACRFRSYSEGKPQSSKISGGHAQETAEHWKISTKKSWLASDSVSRQKFERGYKNGLIATGFTGAAGVSTLSLGMLVLLGFSSGVGLYIGLFGFLVITLALLALGAMLAVGLAYGVGLGLSRLTKLSRARKRRYRRFAQHIRQSSALPREVCHVF